MTSCLASSSSRSRQAAQFIRVVPIHPVAQAYGLFGLDRRIFKHARLAQPHKLGQAIFFDVSLVGEAKFLLDFYFDPQTLAVETILPALVLAQHRLIALVEVFVGTSPAMMDAQRVVGRRRAVDKAVGAVLLLSLGAQTAQFVEGVCFLPEFQYFVFQGDEINLV